MVAVGGSTLAAVEGGNSFADVSAAATNASGKIVLESEIVDNAAAAAAPEAVPAALLEEAPVVEAPRFTGPTKKAGPFVLSWFRPIVYGGCQGGSFAWIENGVAIVMLALLLAAFVLTLKGRCAFANKIILAAMLALVCLVLRLAWVSAGTCEQMMKGSESCYSLPATIFRYLTHIVSLATVAGLFLVPTMLAQLIKRSAGESPWRKTGVLILVAGVTAMIIRIGWLAYMGEY